MTIEISQHGAARIVRLRGELVGGSGELVERVTDLLTGRRARVVIDLGEVPFVNSTGLGELVRIVAQANVQESRVVLANPSPHVAGVLQATQLTRFFEICPTVDEALLRLR